MTTNIKNKINNVENTLTSKIENVKNTLNNSAYASSTVNSIVHKNGLEYIGGIKKFLSGNISIFNPNIIGKGSLNELPEEEEYRSSIDFKGVRPNSTADQLELSSNIGGIQSSIKGNITRTDIYATKYNSTKSISSKISINYFSDGNKENDVYFTYVDTPVGPDKISYALGNDKGSEYDHQITNVLWTRTALDALENKINSNFVKLSDAQTITGKKTFSTSPIISNIDTTNEKSVATIGYVSDSITDNNKSYYTKSEVDNKDAQLVTLSTNQTISGIKNFTKHIKLQNVDINTETETSKATNVKSVKDFVNKKINDVVSDYTLGDIVRKTNTDSFSIKAGNISLVGNKDTTITWNGKKLVDADLLNSTVSNNVNSLTNNFNKLKKDVDEKLKYTWYRDPSIKDDLTNQVYGSSANLDTWWNWNHGGSRNIRSNLTLEEDIKFLHPFSAIGLNLSKTSLDVKKDLNIRKNSILKAGSKIYIPQGQNIKFDVGVIQFYRNGSWVSNTEKLIYYSNVIFDTDVKVTPNSHWNCRWGACFEKGSTLADTSIPSETVIKKGTILTTDFTVPNYEIVFSKSIRNYDEIMFIYCTDSAGNDVEYKTYPIWLWDKFVSAAPKNVVSKYHIGNPSSWANIKGKNIGYQNFTVDDENNLLGCILGIKYDPVN